jgi:hypothetical protein
VSAVKVYKTSPFIPITDHFDARYSFSTEDAALMASMGYNTIRLGVLWAGLEPTRGAYNLTYLGQVQEAVRIAGEAGILSVLDMHQDVFNRKYCGNGVPDWAARPTEENFPYPLEVEYEVDENNYPSREDCGRKDWPIYHFSHRHRTGSTITLIFLTPASPKPSEGSMTTTRDFLTSSPCSGARWQRHLLEVRLFLSSLIHQIPPR